MDAIKLLAEPGVHEGPITTGFDGNIRYTGAQPLFDSPLVVILFTNRCGSNLFAEHLRNTGRLGGLQEAANYPNVLKQREKFGFASYPDLVAANARKQIDKGKVYGLKASVKQLAMLLRWNIPAMFSGLVVYQLVRDNLVDQAISMSIAKQTGKWSSKIKTAESKDPVFNFADISKFIDNTVEQNIAASLLVEALDVPHAVFRYEEFIPDPAPHIRRALGVLGISAPDLAIVEPTLARLANEVNAAFRDSYMEELMRRMAAAGQGAAAEGTFFQRVIRGRRRA